jgi:drug/metabolite transporter (DMT)-like permease
MNDSQLDTLLNAPLAALADGGFSARVIARARKERLKEQAAFLASVFICAAAMLVFVPLPQITAAMAHVLTAALPAISLAIAALVLTFTAERALAQR